MLTVVGVCHEISIFSASRRVGGRVGCEQIADPMSPAGRWI
jgi:hypothetical protein